MAEILPFKAFRFNTGQEKLGDVLTQPYDKITPEMQAKYYELSPHNIVRIVLGKAGETDTDAFNIYTRAAEYFHDWRASGVLRQDDEPSIYVYSQTFTIPGSRDVAERRCLIARGRIYDYEENVIFPSEHTLSRPKLDRLNLLRATKANFGQILMLYSDPAGNIQPMLKT